LQRRLAEGTVRINVRADSSARDKSRAVIQAYDWSRRAKFLCADSETERLTGITRADGETNNA
jgi:hypothetical protein